MMNSLLRLIKISNLRKTVIALIQIGILYFFSLMGNYLAELFHFNFPGSLIGMGILFTLLRLGIFPFKWVDIGGNWLLAELLLFFIPSVVAIMQYKQFFHQEGLNLFLIILIGTVAVMVSSGLTAELIIKSKGGKT
ncbi:CidA/LrgA family holin-like protein [Desulfosporosinus sp. PR]|uniref:CidA/LrgA family holin-like protein n=1 Tax=Candidatus Desulfosporosinus nitrosoreducens TaxID=3401928 RepID=UPI0027F25F26|nr:CidA/LrgA family holin-like protein [Desulfosporosinus sp. PR]MDQ7097113.1 CidA/LrgA family holin-like protein [Desulfosporosinus sp. PR]